MWRKFYDGWFEYYYNIETGEKKFKLDPGDILVDNGHIKPSEVCGQGGEGQE